MEFRILGPLEAEHGGTAVALGSARERTLLAILLLSGNQVVSVDRLTDEVWGEEAPERAVASLRVHLSRLRKSLQATGDTRDRIVTKSPGYSLMLERDELDATRFDDLTEVARRQRAGGDHAAAAQVLRQALALWRGPALADVSDHPFAVSEVTRLEEYRLGALEERVDADLACGRHAELVGELEALVAEHPLRERLWGQRMVALYRSGRQAEALRAYGELRHLLGEELGIEPTATLRRLEEAILLQKAELDWDGVAAAAPAVAVTPGTNGATRPGWLPIPLPLPPALASLQARFFVGRARELAAFEGALQRAAGHERELVLLAGDPGIGKTASATQMATHAHSRGWSVLYGRCDEEDLVPFQPFVEAIRYCLETADLDALEAELGAQLADVSRVVPLPPGAAAAHPAAPVDPHTERYRLFEAVAALLRSITGPRPAVLVLDDLQWADKSTLSLLRYLLRQASLTNIVILGTFRHTDVDDEHPLTVTLADLRREHGVTRLRLAGLTPQDVTNALPAWRNAEPRSGDAALASALWRRTQGNPLFMQELLAEIETQPVTEGRDMLERLHDLGVPEGVKEVILRRLARLSTGARGLLEVAAVIGQEFRAEVIERMGELPAPELDDAIEEAIGAGLISEAPGQPGQYAFSHTLVRETLYQSRTATRQRRVHAQVGAALEDLDATHALWLPELAYHHLKAAPLVEVDKAVSYAQLAGNQALARLAFEEAADFYASALDIVERTQATPDARVVELTLGLADARIGSGENEGAAVAFERAATLAGTLGVPDLLARAALGYEDASYGARGFAIDPSVKPAVDLLQRALAALGEEETALRALVLARLPRQLSYTAPPDQRLSYATEALELAERLGSPAVKAAALNGLSWAQLGLDNVEERLATATELVAVAEESGDLVNRFWGHVWRFEAYVELGHAVGLEGELDALQRLSEELRAPFYLWWVSVYRAAYSALSSPIDDAQRLAEEAFALGRRMESSIAIQIFGIQLFFLRYHQGRLHEMEGAARDLAAREPFMPSSQIGLTFLLAETGATAEARERFETHAGDGFASIPRSSPWMVTMLHLVEICVALGDGERAGALSALLQPYATRNISAGIGIASGGPVARLLGVLAHVQGELDAAERSFEIGLDLCDRTGAEIWGAHTRRNYAALLATRDGSGDHERAQRLLGEARATAERLGLGRILA